MRETSDKKHEKGKEQAQFAFQKFVFDYSDSLFRYSLCILHSKEEAEEIVSDVFMDVWRQWEDLDKIKKIRSWLFTLAHNKSISLLRKNQKDKSVISLDEYSEFNLYTNLQTPDEEIISKEEIEEINSLIQTLSPRCKEVFLLAKIEHLPYKEISTILDISVKTINIHVAKALEIISKGLK